MCRRPTTIDSLRGGVGWAVLLLTLVTGCSRSDYGFKPLAADYPPRPDPARPSTLTLRQLQERGYRLIGSITGTRRLDRPYEELYYRQQREQLTRGNRSFSSVLPQQTLMEIYQLAGDHGGDLVVRQPDTDYQDLARTAVPASYGGLGTHPYYYHDHVCQDTWSPWSRRRAPGRFTYRRRSYEHSEIWGPLTRSHGQYVFVTLPFTFVTHSWQVWRQDQLCPEFNSPPGSKARQDRVAVGPTTTDG